MGSNFCGKSEKALKVDLNFVTVISPGAWHCTSDDVIDLVGNFVTAKSTMKMRKISTPQKLPAI